MKLKFSDFSNSGRATLGSGEYGTVYQVKDFTLPDVNFPLAFKKYKRIHLPISAASLNSLSTVRDTMEPRQRARLDEIATWPIRVVVEDSAPGLAIGVLMRLLSDEYVFQQTKLSGPPTPRLRDLQFAVQDQDFCRRVGVEYLREGERFSLLGNLAYALAFLHKAKVVYGDLSFLNVVFSRPKNAEVSVVLIDCDAALKVGTASAFGKQPHSGDFVPPEAEAIAVIRRAAGTSIDPIEEVALGHAWARQTFASDVYKYALMVIRILDHGAGKSANRSPDDALRRLPSEMRLLLTESLLAAPHGRPTMADWNAAFRPKKDPSPYPGWRRRADGSWYRG